MSDLIERQAVIDWLKYKWNRSADSLFYGIQGLSSAQSESKIGKWIWEYDETNPNKSIRICSVCGRKRYDDLISVYSFCPYCGASMRER